MSELDLQAQLDALKARLAVDTPPEKPLQKKHYSASELAELVKFEQFPSEITVMAGKPPGNPWKFRPFPRMLRMARQHPKTGKWVMSLERPNRYDFPTETQYDQAREQYEKFSESCLRVVQTEREYDAAKAEGWRDTDKEAFEFREQEQAKLAQEAAERAYRDRNMSENAKAEAEKVEAETFGHVAEIPEAPRRRGRPAKQADPAA